MSVLGAPQFSETANIPKRTARHILVDAADKHRIISPALQTKHGSAERAQEIRNLAAQPVHQIGGKHLPVTLYDWLKAAEGGVSGLFPSPRSDRGGRRVRISRAWDIGCGLPEDVQDQIAAKLAASARGLFANGRSERNVRTLCAVELQKLTTEAGADLNRPGFYRSVSGSMIRLLFRQRSSVRRMSPLLHAA